MFEPNHHFLHMTIRTKISLKQLKLLQRQNLSITNVYTLQGTRLNQIRLIEVSNNNEVEISQLSALMNALQHNNTVQAIKFIDSPLSHEAASIIARYYQYK